MAVKKKVDEYRERLIFQYASVSLGLSPNDLLNIEQAAHHLAEAESLDNRVRRDGVMIEGGNRKGMQVMNPLIEEARKQRTSASALLNRIEIPESAGGTRKLTRSEQNRKNASRRYQ